LESGNTRAVSHWSDSMEKRENGKGREKEGRRAQRNGQQNNNKQRQDSKMCQGKTKSTTSRKGTARESNVNLTERVPMADMTDRRGAKRKQKRTDRGKVLKSRILKIQMTQSEGDGNCDRPVQRPGVRTRMCRREEEVEANLLITKDTAGDSGPRGIG
jgi:hypothetical protein